MDVTIIYCASCTAVDLVFCSESKEPPNFSLLQFADILDDVFLLWVSRSLLLAGFLPWPAALSVALSAGRLVRWSEKIPNFLVATVFTLGSWNLAWRSNVCLCAKPCRNTHTHTHTHTLSLKLSCPAPWITHQPLVVDCRLLWEVSCDGAVAAPANNDCLFALVVGHINNTSPKHHPA